MNNSITNPDANRDTAETNGPAGTDSPTGTGGPAVTDSPTGTGGPTGTRRAGTLRLTARLLYFLPALLLAVMIFFFSSQNAADSTIVSQSVTARFILFAGHALGLSVSEGDLTTFIGLYETPVRKLAHFSEYAVFGFFLLFGFYHNRLRSRRALFLTILLAAGYAASDELHQLFSPGRSAQVLDVLIDSAGAVTGTLFYYLLHRRNFRK